MILIVDTETTNLPPSYASPWITEAWDVCRMVQIAWEVLDARTGSCVERRCYTIRPDGYTIPEAASKIHGITQENAENTGVAISVVWRDLERVMQDYSIDRLVAHNIKFDHAVVASELIRYNELTILHTWDKLERYCTMKSATKPNQRWPKLMNLYKEYFGKEFEGAAHQADNDVRACAEIYLHQVRKNSKDKVE